MQLEHGGSARISGQELRGKTGTTNNDSSSYFCGFTQYYTAAVWLGFDREADGNSGGNANSTICANLFRTVMTPVHSGKPSKGWDKPSGITTAVICNVSGKLATEECRHDPRGNRAYSEYFRTGTAPTEYCSVHKSIEICNKTGKLATENCTDKVSKVFITRENASTSTAWKSAADSKYMPPSEMCEECKTPISPEPDDPITDPEGNTNNSNTSNTNTNKNNTTTNTNTNKNNTTTNTNTNKNNTTTNTNKNNTTTH